MKAAERRRMHPSFAEKMFAEEEEGSWKEKDCRVSGNAAYEAQRYHCSVSGWLFVRYGVSVLDHAYHAAYPLRPFE